MRARGSRSTAQRWVIGLAKRPGCLIRWWQRSGGMSSRRRKSMATTPRCRCWRQGSGAPQPGGCGFMCATIGCLPDPRLRPPPIFTVPIVARSIRRRTWRASPASCRLTAMLALRGCTIRRGPSPARSPKLPVGRIAAGNFTTCGRAPNRRSRRKRWIGSPKSTPSRIRPGLPCRRAGGAPTCVGTAARCVLHLGRGCRG
jgi:hypothetical protein